MAKNSVVHFEMPYDNAERVAAFYRTAFGWGMENAGPKMGDYVTAQTAETNEEQMVTQPGAINGGFYPRKPDWPDQSPSVVIAVEDIMAAMERVTNAGGEMLGEPVEIPYVGSYVSFRDTEGNRVSLLHPHQ